MTELKQCQKQINAPMVHLVKALPKKEKMHQMYLYICNVKLSERPMGNIQIQNIHLQRMAVLQCVAVCCSVLQCVAGCCSTMYIYNLWLMQRPMWKHS